MTVALSDCLDGLFGTVVLSPQAVFFIAHMGVAQNAESPRVLCTPRLLALTPRRRGDAQKRGQEKPRRRFSEDVGRTVRAF